MTSGGEVSRSFPGAQLCIASVAIFVSLQIVQADEVIMRNGDRLTGDVTRQDAGVLTLKTSYAGTIAIDWVQVSEVKLDEPQKVLLDGGIVPEVAAVSRDEDRVILHRVAPSQSMTVDASRVKVIEPKPWELGEGYTLGGRVNLALKIEKGNSESNEADFDFMLDYRRRWHRLESSGQLEFDTSHGDKTADKWYWSSRYSRLFPSPWYLGGWITLKHDRFQDLRLQSVIGPTLGYRFFESRPANLRAEIGVLSLQEDFYDQPDEAD